MKVSTEWLADYVELPPTTSMLATRLTLAGLEVEAIESPATALKGVVVALIKESSPHPNADKLSVTQIDIGEAALFQVVCGAKNYKIGDKVPLATVGTKLPNGTEIKAAQLRGVDSFGMLCSSRELGLSEEHAGLMILDPALKVGTPVADALGLKGAVLTLNVTPNRADALSHLGVAREVSALTGNAVKVPHSKLSESGGAASEKIQIRIDAPDRCLRYAARVIEGVKIGESPKWLLDRLKAVGVRPISNVVDITNYVLFEYGQPLHAFDLDQVGGAQIIVRTAKPNEKMVTLDGKERALDPDDLLICDRDKPQVLAGVMGGQNSEVNEKTTRVLLEAANFLPASVRRSAKRHALHSESSHRFERGTDANGIPSVLDRAASLIAEIAGGTVLKGVVDVYPKKIDPRRVTLRYLRISTVLGVEVPAEQAKAILTNLGFKLLEHEADSGMYEVPGYRPDVEREEDLIEEVARVRGFDTIPAALPRGASEFVPEAKGYSVDSRVRGALSGAGFDEVVNYSFVAPEELKAVSAPEPWIALLNPLSVEQSVMRTSIYPGLLKNLSHALRHGVDTVRLYEFGRTYHPDPEGGQGARPPATEKLTVGGVVHGRRNGRTWTSKDEAADFYDAKGGVEAVLQALGIKGAEFVAAERAELHPRATAEVRVNGRVLGHLGELHPRSRNKLDLPAGVFLFALDFLQLHEATTLVPGYAPPTKFPAVLRDLAVVVPTTLEHESVRKVIREIGGALVEDAVLFDVYTGKPIPDGQKNLAYALRYRSADRTLTDIEVNDAHAKIVAEVTKKLGGQLRS